MVVFYNEQLEKRLAKWPAALRARFGRILDLIREHGTNLGMPLTRAMGGGLFEVRVKAKDGIGRVFFTYMRQKEIMILHSFIKKTQETPKKELRLAKQRLQEVLYGKI